MASACYRPSASTVFTCTAFSSAARASSAEFASPILFPNSVCEIPVFCGWRSTGGDRPGAGKNHSALLGGRAVFLQKLGVFFRGGDNPGGPVAPPLPGSKETAPASTPTPDVE